MRRLQLIFFADQLGYAGKAFLPERQPGRLAGGKYAADFHDQASGVHRGGSLTALCAVAGLNFLQCFPVHFNQGATELHRPARGLQCFLLFVLFE